MLPLEPMYAFKVNASVDARVNAHARCEYSHKYAHVRFECDRT